MTRDPTVEQPERACSCHWDIAEQNGNSLHTTLAGIRHSIVARSGGESLTEHLQEAFGNHCGRCHSSCGQCHVSVPTSAGGGFLKGHQIRRTPPMNNVCVACHGSRVGDEYKGQNAGIRADAHYNKGMQCTACHTMAEMHGDTQAGVGNRYEVAAAPRCQDCHPDDADFKTQPSHSVHRREDGSMKLQCQVCHSVEYKNCYGCHVSLNEDGKAVYEVNAPDHESVMTFRIGRNPMKDALHPEDWVVLRHVPIDPDNYDFYAPDALTTFDALPTWRLATPHNIQRVTPQNEGCMGTCHNNRDLFLAPEDLRDYEVQANQGVVVDAPPPVSP